MRCTCKWCGKQYDSSQAFLGGVQKNQSYCSKRCENAGERARQKEQERADENMKELLGAIGCGNYKVGCLIVAVFVILFFLIFGHNYSNQSGEGDVENVQETVNTQVSGEQKSNVKSVLQSDMEILEEGTEDLTMAQNCTIEEDVVIPEKEEEIIEEDLAPIEEEDFSKQKIYDIVEEMPIFPGGDYELIKYIAENLDYPQEALESGIQGRVFVKIIVEPNGSISNVKIIRGLGYGCDEEAIRVIESMPNWEPGRKNGEAVRVNMAVPVNFKLQ